MFDYKKMMVSLMCAAGAMAPALAWADGGCGSPWSSWGCFWLHLLVLGFAAIPAALVGAIVAWFWLQSRLSPAWRALVVAAGIPMAYLNTSLVISVWDTIAPGVGGSAFMLASWVLVTGLQILQIALLHWILKTKARSHAEALRVPDP